MAKASAFAAVASAGASVYTASQSSRAARQANANAERIIRYQEYFLEKDKQRNEEFTPAIDQELRDIVATPKATMQTQAAIARAFAPIEADLARAARKLRECASMYCAPGTAAQIAQLTVQAGVAKADAASAAVRAEEARVQLLNDKRRTDIVTTVGRITRGDFSESLRAAQSLLTYYTQQQAAATKALSGSLKELGYQTTRLGQMATQQGPRDASWGSDAVDRRTRELLAELAGSGAGNTGGTQPQPDLGDGWTTYGTSEGE